MSNDKASYMTLGTFTRNFICWVGLHISYNAQLGETEQQT